MDTDGGEAKYHCVSVFIRGSVWSAGASSRFQNGGKPPYSKNGGFAKTALPHTVPLIRFNSSASRISTIPSCIRMRFFS
jgi:hypothetical protein